MKKQLTMFTLIAAVASLGLVGCAEDISEIVMKKAEAVDAGGVDQVVPAGAEDVVVPPEATDTGDADTQSPSRLTGIGDRTSGTGPSKGLLDAIAAGFASSTETASTLSNVTIKPYENNLPFLKVAFDFTGEEPKVTLENGSNCGPIEVSGQHRAYECAINKESATLDTKINVAEKTFRFVAGQKAWVALSEAASSHMIDASIARLYTISNETDHEYLEKGSTCMGEEIEFKAFGHGKTETVRIELTGQSDCRVSAVVPMGNCYDKYKAVYTDYAGTESLSLELNLHVDGKECPWNSSDDKPTPESGAIFKIEDTGQECSSIPIASSGAVQYRPAIMSASVTFEVKNVTNIQSSNCLISVSDTSDDQVTVIVLNPLVQMDNEYNAMHWDNEGNAVLSCDFKAKFANGETRTRRANWSCAK